MSHLEGLSIFLILFITNVSAKNPLYRPAVEGHSARGWYKNVGVAADSEICGQVAVDILRRNGSVVDAGVAAQLCNGVVDQIHMGLGGGAVSLVYESPNDDPDGAKELVYISGDVTAPGWVDQHSLDGMDMHAPLWMKVDASRIVQEWQSNMILTIGVPGEIAGYFAAWERYGRLPWHEVVKPALDLAQHGWTISNQMAKVLFEFTEKIKTTQSLSFFKKQISPGQYVPTMFGVGDTMYDPVLARTLNTIAHHGPHAFYHGHLADMIVDDVQRLGGRLTKQDLREQKARFLEAVEVPLEGGEYIAYVPPSPYSGPLVAILYNIVSGYNMTSSDLSRKEGLALFYHRLIEAWKYTMAHLNCIGEGFHLVEECQEINGEMSSAAYGDKIRALISDDKASTDMEHYNVLRRQDTVDQHGTSHLSLVGSNGAVFSSTSTIFLEFGCGAKGSQTGIIFNNALTDFHRKNSAMDKDPEFHANFLQRGKMAGSMRAPVLVTNTEGNTVLTLGASGGVRIPTAIVQDLLFHLHFGLDLQEAIDYPRIAAYPYPGYPTYHDQLAQEVVDILKSKGQENLDYYFPSFPYTGVVQAVSRLKCQKCSASDCPENCIEAVSDYRKGGAPAGY